MTIKRRDVAGRPTNGRFREALMAVPTTVLGRYRDDWSGWISAGLLSGDNA
jgi:hypothetical protein